VIFLCPDFEFVTILLNARHEELMVWSIVECSLLLQAMYEVLQTGIKEEEKMCIQLWAEI
jgi:hypothetical protein